MSEISKEALAATEYLRRSGRNPPSRWDARSDMDDFCMETIQNAIDSATVSRDARIKKMEAELAECRKDKARLDWLSCKDVIVEWHDEIADEFKHLMFDPAAAKDSTLRQQIDEAMK